MQKELSQMTMSELATIAIPVIMNFRCDCCGSIDLAHDVELCKQAAYIGFDEWRAGEMKAGRWEVEEYSDNESGALDGEEYSGPAFDEMMLPHSICPAMGLY